MQGSQSHHQLEKVAGVHGLRIGMMTAEVRQGVAVDDRSGWRAKAAFQDGFGVRTGNGVHGIEAHPEPRPNRFVMPSKSSRLSISVA